jgi:hypothetical protein
LDIQAFGPQGPVTLTLEAVGQFAAHKLHICTDLGPLEQRRDSNTPVASGDLR